MRNHSRCDELIGKADDALRTLAGVVTGSERPHPADGIAEAELDDDERKLSMRLMRVNHAGEIAAQGLYHGQALASCKTETRDWMLENAHEESDHLYWCRRRVEELGGRTSLLAPMWYAGSVAIGVAVGLFGDKWNHSFVKETEDQVVDHLQSHLGRVSEKDRVTRVIIAQIKQDEAEHARAAAAGAAELPGPVRALMKLTAKIMTAGAYRL